MRLLGVIYNRRSFLVFIPVLVFFITLTASTANAVHKGAGGLTCGQCHTMHNSQGSTSGTDQDLGGLAGGSMILLRANVSSRAEIHKLCLQCHASNGAQATTAQQPHGQVAPKVYSTGTWNFKTDAFNKIGAGGNFSTELDSGWGVTTATALGYGHSLGATNVTPPGGDAAIAEFSCTNCHDPHGTASVSDANVNIFRNLKVYARGAGAESGVKFISNLATPWFEHKSYVGGVNGSYFGGSETDNAGNVIWPVYRGTLTGDTATDALNSNSYGTGSFNQSYPTVATMSRWCAQCHDSWHERVSTTNKIVDYSKYGTDGFRMWRRHGVSMAIPRAAAPGCASGCHKSALDRSNYNIGIITAGKGLPVTANKIDDPNNDTYYLGTGGAGTWGGEMLGAGSQVFCLTCHFAHGGPYYDNLRWDYLAGVASGSQTANSIESTTGCQLCHNR
ncbi:hypothetical protein MNBD_DELTA01-247 [hydrothermal vent metagenome]|uniref:Doubled CXXCH motif domain-containing protein n=1 Tax=hydrothermal vent metagenome TaxID=652676 RepID=A0A3B0QLZ9_9ZZZZ